MAGLAFETVALDRGRRRDSGKDRYKIGPFCEFLSNAKQRGKGIWSGSEKQEGKRRTAAEWEEGKAACWPISITGLWCPRGRGRGRGVQKLQVFWSSTRIWRS